MIHWLREHFELLSASVLGIFGFGGLVVTHKNHGKRLDDLENKEEKQANDLAEIKGDIKVLLERTKKL